MANLNFPTSPALDSTHTMGSTTYQWNGTAWLIHRNSATTVESLAHEVRELRLLVQQLVNSRN